MLDYDKFKKIICSELKNRLSKDDLLVELKVSAANTINNTKKDKLSVINPSQPDAYPIFYLNDIYKYYNACGDMYATVNDVANEIKRTFSNMPVINVSRDTVEHNVYYSLVNCEQNRELLQHIPHRNFYDLAITYRVELTDTSDFLVTNKVMDDIGLTENDLYVSACKNTPAILGEVCCMKLDDWYINELKAAINNTINYKESESQEKESEPIYVFKFKNSNEYGSSVILYGDALEKAADKINDNLVMMFPNSDELMVTSTKCSNERLDELFGGDRIPTEKFLSNKKYLYDRHTKKVSIRSTCDVSLDNVVPDRRHNKSR